MNTTSTQEMHFPHDIVLDIQLRLPAKSLFRFKSVSQTWGNQISSPSFREMYHKQSKKNHNLLLCRNILRLGASPEVNASAEWESFNTKTLSVNHSFTTRGKVINMMVSSCQGMICFLSTNGEDEIDISLYCLTTKKLVVLPIDPSSGFYKGPIFGFGIGYLSSAKMYKVALLFLKDRELEYYDQPSPRFNCQVIEISNSHGDGSRNYSNWRIVEAKFNVPVDTFRLPVFLEKTLYWKAWGYDCILSFDIENENFDLINYPKENDFSVTDDMCLVDLQGELGLVVASKAHEGYFTMVIWKLQDNNNDIWEKKYIVSLKDTKLNRLVHLRSLLLQDEEIIMFSRGCLVFYNLEKNTYKILDTNVPTNYALVGMHYENLYIS